MQIAQFAKAVFNLSAICKMKKCLSDFASEDYTVINLCVLIAQFAKAVFNLSAICKTKKCLFRSTRWRIVPLSICVICANCTICKSCFQFECNLQNEEMSFQIYSLEDRTVINLCNLCKLHNLQKLFSIWVQSAKWRNVFSDLPLRRIVPLSICVICVIKIAQFAKAVFNLSGICKTKKCLFRSTRWRIVPLSICVICANCTIYKSKSFQFECNLQNEEMSFQIYSLEDRTVINLGNLLIAQFAKAVFNLSAICKTKKCLFRSTRWRIVLINLCNLCKLHNLQKLFSIWVQSAKRRNVFSDLLVGGSYPYQGNLYKLHNLQKLFSIECNLQNEEMSFQIYFGGSYPYQFV